ncbi:glutathione S-transferase theta-1-like isoform X2 [Pleurodeles waltl]|uniref:glutathione S-transferase theta-1-like isoform X2 n=1 Tax=Pleurodeles waltl TaxID=8319 RepID=UPI0037097F30
MPEVPRRWAAFVIRVAQACREQYSPEFKSVNPLRNVPTLKDGDFTLAESIAILLYLASKFNTPDHWYPADLEKRARVDEYLSWQHSSVRAHSSRVFCYKALMPILFGNETDPEKMEAAMKELRTTLDQFEEKFLQDKPFIVGDEISLADLIAIVELMQPVGAGVDTFKDRPKLDAWQGRVVAALGTELFQDTHKYILNCMNMKREPLNPVMVEALKTKLRFI